MAGDGAGLIDRARSAAASLKRHKSAIREHRRGAQEAAAELARIEAECARRGIAVRLEPSPAAPATDAHPGRGAAKGRA